MKCARRCRHDPWRRVKRLVRRDPRWRNTRMTTTDRSVSDRQELTEEEARALGVEAYVYGYPLLVMDSLRRVTTNVAGPRGTLAPMGQFAPHRAFPGASEGSSIAGASLDTLYSLAWLDLSQGPFLLRLPAVGGRFYMMPILDGWTEVIGNPGTRTTGASPVEYVITGPGWTGELPAGAERIECGTDMVLLVGRTYCSGTVADYEAVHALQNEYTLIPLSGAGEPNPGRELGGRGSERGHDYAASRSDRQPQRCRVL